MGTEVAAGSPEHESHREGTPASDVPASDVTVRPAIPADAPGIARVHVDTWRTTYRGLVPDEVLAGLSYEKGQARWERTLQDPESGQFVFVAADGKSGQVVGFAVAGPERTGDPVYTGEVYAIYILEAYQRKGLGRRLIGACARELAGRDRKAMLIWVLRDNPNRPFYEALGGVKLRSQPLEIGGATLEEIAYGWPDISGLNPAGPP